MVYRKHEVTVEHNWNPPVQLPEDRSITTQTCADCGQMRQTLHLPSNLSECEPVTSEDVFQTMESLRSQIQKMLTNLTGFKDCKQGFE